MKRIVLLLVLFVGFCVVQSQQITRGPYLQVGTPESVVVRWRTDVAVIGKVAYGLQHTNLSMSVVEDSATTEHELKITGLNDATVYFYNVGTINQVLLGASTEMYFKTSPQPGTRKPYRFWVIGDFGNGTKEQKDVRDAYLNFNGTTHTDAWIWLGDNAYSKGTDEEYQKKVFEVYPEEFKKMIPWPCPGNHDYGSVTINNTGPYFDNFTMPVNGEAGGEPSGTEGYFSFDYGNVHFVSLNTEYLAWVVTNSTAMANWLKNDLAKNTRDWTIVYFHQPPYSKGSHDSDDNFSRMEFMRTNFNPIFEQYGVDLVLTGHSHGYERSYMIKGHYGKSNTFNASTMIVDDASPFIKYTDGAKVNEGTVYAVVGCSGQLSNSGSMNHPANAISTNSYRGSMVIDVNDLTLTAKFLTAYDGVKDEFVIRKGSVNDNLSSISEITSAHSFSVVPNPSNGSFEIKFNSSFPSAKIELLNVEGKSIEQRNAGDISSGEVKRFAFPNLNKGFYLLRVSSPEMSVVKRIVVN